VNQELLSEHTPASVLARLLHSSSDRGHAQTLLQIWAEIPRDPELEEIARHSLLELRALINPSRCAAIESKLPADAITDAVLTAVQGHLVRITIDRNVDTDLLARRTVAIFEHL